MSEMYGPSKEEFLKQQLKVIDEEYKKAKEREKGERGIRTIYNDGNVMVSTYKDRTYINRPKHPRTVRPRQRMIVMLYEAGWRAKDIAKSLGYSEVRVNQIINSKHPELIKVRNETASKVAENITDTQLRIRLYANEMLDRMVEHARDTQNPANSRMAARDILHMAGYAPVRRNLNVDVQVPGQELIKAANKIQEANEVAANYQRWSVSEDKSNDNP